MGPKRILNRGGQTVAFHRKTVQFQLEVEKEKGPVLMSVEAVLVTQRREGGGEGGRMMGPW